MKMKKLVAIGVSSLFLFATGCDDSSNLGSFINNSGNQTGQQSGDQSISFSLPEISDFSLPDISIDFSDISIPDFSDVSIADFSEISFPDISIPELSESVEGVEVPPVTTGQKPSVNLDKLEEFPNMTVRSSSDWTFLEKDTQDVEAEVYQSYVEQGIQDHLTYKIKMYDVLGDSLTDNYLFLNYFSIEYADSVKSQFNLDSIFATMIDSLIATEEEPTKIQVDGKDFLYVRGYDISTNEPAIFAMGSDGDNSYGGLIFSFTMGLESPEEAEAFFNTIVNEIRFK